MGVYPSYIASIIFFCALLIFMGMLFREGKDSPTWPIQAPVRASKEQRAPEHIVVKVAIVGRGA